MFFEFFSGFFNKDLCFGFLKTMCFSSLLVLCLGFLVLGLGFGWFWL